MLMSAYATQHPKVIDTLLAMALGKDRLKTRHLRVCQPEKVAHGSASLRSLNRAARLGWFLPYLEPLFENYDRKATFPVSIS